MLISGVLLVIAFGLSSRKVAPRAVVNSEAIASAADTRRRHDVAIVEELKAELATLKTQTAGQYATLEKLTAEAATAKAAAAAAASSTSALPLEYMYMFPSEIAQTRKQVRSPVKCGNAHGAGKAVAAALEASLGNQCGCNTALLPAPPAPYPWHSLEIMKSNFD